jgi:predicted S18 family serine protease
MKQEVIETVVIELLEEEKQVKKVLEDIKLNIFDTSNEIKIFKDYVTKIKLTVPPIDNATSELLLKNNLIEMRKEIEKLKIAIIAERKHQTVKELLMYYLGWILLLVMLVIFLVVLFK